MRRHRTQRMVVPNARNAKLMTTNHKRPYRRGDGGPPPEPPIEFATHHYDMSVPDSYDPDGSAWRCQLGNTTLTAEITPPTVEADTGPTGGPSMQFARTDMWWGGELVADGSFFIIVMRYADGTGTYVNNYYAVIGGESSQNASTPRGIATETPNPNPWIINGEEVSVATDFYPLDYSVCEMLPNIGQASKTIGGRGGAGLGDDRGFAGNIVELIICSQKPSEEALVTLRAELNAKWQLGGGPPTPGVGPFVMTVETTIPDEAVRIPCTDNGTFDATIDWGDGTVVPVTSFDDVNLNNTYAVPGTYTVSITGQLPNVQFYLSDAGGFVRTVDHLGSVGWVTLFGAFQDCPNLTSVTAGVCDTSGVLSVERFLSQADALVQLDLRGMDTTQAENWRYFLTGSQLTSVDVSMLQFDSCTNLTGAFQDNALMTGCTFPQNSPATNNLTCSSMFEDCTALLGLDAPPNFFGQPTNLSSMFRAARSITSADMSNQDLTSVTNIGRMFRSCTDLQTAVFPVTGFNLTGSNNEVFRDASSLTDVDVSLVDVSNCTSLTQWLRGANSLTSVVGMDTWQVSNVTELGLDLLMTSASGRMTTPQYDATLINFADQIPNHLATLEPDFGQSQYTVGGAAEAARNALTTHGWTITDGGPAPLVNQTSGYVIASPQSPADSQFIDPDGPGADALEINGAVPSYFGSASKTTLILDIDDQGNDILMTFGDYKEPIRMVFDTTKNGPYIYEGADVRAVLEAGRGKVVDIRYTVARA